jgi:hypothetical protein
MKIIENFNRRFHNVPVLSHSQTFPKSFPDFLFLSEPSKEKELGVKWFFEINFSP